MKRPPVAPGDEDTDAKYKTRVFTANGVGLSFASQLDFEFELGDPIPQFSFTLNGKSYPIHSYIRQRIITDDLRLKLRVANLSRPVFPRKIGGFSVNSVDDYYAIIQRQKEKYEALGQSITKEQITSALAENCIQSRRLIGAIDAYFADDLFDDVLPGKDPAVEEILSAEAFLEKLSVVNTSSNYLDAITLLKHFTT